MEHRLNNILSNYRKIQNFGETSEAKKKTKEKQIKATSHSTVHHKATKYTNPLRIQSTLPKNGKSKFKIILLKL